MKKSKGLGDTIAKITEATGIDKLVKFSKLVVELYSKILTFCVAII